MIELPKMPAEQTRDKYGQPSEHAVMEGKLIYTSPSQVKTFDRESEGGCERKWFYEKVCHFPKKKLFANDVGQAGHAQVEHYLITGENVLGTIMLAGLQYLPQPKSRLKIEWPVHYIPKDPTKVDAELEAQPKLYLAGLPHVGFIDLVDENLLEQGIIVVTDHKTTSSIDRYAKTTGELRKDPQAGAYLKWAKMRYKVPNYVFRHIYYQTKGARRSEPVAAPFTALEVDQAASRIEAVVERMKAVAATKNPNDVPACDDACNAYGGCSYAGICSASPSRRFTMSVLDRLKGGSTDTTNTAPATPSGASTAIPAKTGKTDQKYIINGQVYSFLAFTGANTIFQDAEGKTAKFPPDTMMTPVEAPAPAAPAAPAAAAPAVPAAPATLNCSACGATLTPENSSKLQDGRIVHVGCQKAVQAPVTHDMAQIPVASCITGKTYRSGTKNLLFQCLAGTSGVFLDGQTPVMLALTEVVVPVAAVVESAPTPAGNVVRLTDAAESVRPPDTASAPPPPPAPEAPAAEAKPKRTRKAAAPAATAAPGAPVAPTAPVAPATPAAPPATTEVAQGAPGLRIYYNCVPNKPYRDLSVYVAELAKAIAASASTEDVRIQDAGPLSYGKWVGYMAEAARQQPPTGDCVIWKSDLADPVFNALAPLAELVVRAR